jgi:hypothetical protein
MKFEVIETGDAWIVQNEGVEEARFEAQEAALNHVAARLKDACPANAPVSLCMRFRAPAA